MNNEVALEYYRRILFDYKGSLYSTESRKRFQAIRSLEKNQSTEVN